MTRVLLKLYRDEAGFIVSAELILIATIAVLGIIVGLAEVAHGVNEELEDVGAAFGSVNQSYRYNGSHGHKACMYGSEFGDKYDFCDGEHDITCDGGASPEMPKHRY